MEYIKKKKPTASFSHRAPVSLYEAISNYNIFSSGF